MKNDTRSSTTSSTRTTGRRRLRVAGEQEPIRLGARGPRRLDFAYARRLVRVLRDGPNTLFGAREGKEILALYLKGGLRAALPALNGLLRRPVTLPHLAQANLPYLPPAERKEIPTAWQPPHVPSVPILLWWYFQSSLLGRIKACAECQALFLDESKAGKGRYCSTACASRAGVRAFRARSSPAHRKSSRRTA